MNVYDYRPGDEKVATMLLVSVVCLVGAFSIGYMLGLRNVSDHGGGADAVGQQLNEVGTNISNATAGIGNAQESADYLQGTVSTSAELIGQSKSIIEAIRRRGKTDQAAH